MRAKEDEEESFLYYPIDLKCDIDDFRSVLRANIELLQRERPNTEAFIE